MKDSTPNQPASGEGPALNNAADSMPETFDSAGNADSGKKPLAKPDQQTPPANADVKEKPSNTAPIQNPTEQAPIVQKQKSPGKGFGVFAIIFSLLALAGSGFTWYQNQVVQVQKESSLSLGVSEIGGQVSRLGDSISRIQRDQSNVVTQEKLSSQLQGMQGALSTEVSVIKEAQADLSESLTKISGNMQKGVNQYVLDEVSQLLRLANNSALFAGNSASAINALSLADNQLKSLSDPRYAAVRAKINQEITLLRNVQGVDVESLSGSLHTISETIATLPLANEPEAQNALAPDAAAPAPTTIRSELKKLWRDIMSSVQVQRVNNPPKPLLVPQQRYFLNQNIQLMIAKSELALMQGQSAIFERSISDAVEWLNDYFDLSDARVSSTIAQLTEMRGKSVASEMPSITGSYEALQNIKGGL